MLYIFLNYVTFITFIILECELNPCGLHGTCNEFPHGYVCVCDVEFTGINCECKIYYVITIDLL